MPFGNECKCRKILDLYCAAEISASSVPRLCPSRCFVKLPDSDQQDCVSMRFTLQKPDANSFRLIRPTNRSCNGDSIRLRRTSISTCDTPMRKPRKLRPLSKSHQAVPMVSYEDSVVLWGEDDNGSEVDLARWWSGGRGFCW